MAPVARTYDSSRRKEAARQTRDAILAAAFELHGRGIFDLESLAEEARVSIATIRRHFPNREMLLEGCTDIGLQLAPMPDHAALAAIADPRELLFEVVRQTFGFHESLFAQLWFGFKLEDESAALAGMLREIKGVVAAMTDIAVSAWPNRGDEPSETRGMVSGMLSPLTYRGLRLHGPLSPEVATRTTTRLLLNAFETDGGRAEREAKHH